MNHLPELGRGNLSLLFVGYLLNEPRVLDGVAGTEEQKALARQAVAPGAASLLVIAFDVLRQIGMNHKANVRLVDAHAESYRRADHAHFIAQEKVLIRRTFFRI